MSSRGITRDEMRNRIQLELAGFWKSIILPTENEKKKIPSVEIRKYSRAEFKYLLSYIRIFKKILDRLIRAFAKKERRFIINQMKNSRFDQRIVELDDPEYDKWSAQYLTDKVVN